MAFDPNLLEGSKKLCVDYVIDPFFFLKGKLYVFWKFQVKWRFFGEVLILRFMKCGSVMYMYIYS